MWLLGTILGLVLLDYFSIIRTNRQVKDLQKQGRKNTIEIIRLNHKLNYYKEQITGDGK
jgi:hypothetical protein